MLIANPIYDSVFKYLMDDPRSAKVIISTIIGEEIEELAFKQRERSAQLATLGVSIFRLDFSAVVKTADGSRKNVLIEIQKADSGDDIPRFRRYLAENYYSPVHKQLEEQETSGASETDAPMVPIITIYILGYPLKHLQGHSAVTIRRHYQDSVTGEEIPAREDFIELLTHDSHVIQVSELKQRRRNKLEQLLALFEQMNLQANKHLKVFEDELPEEFQTVLDRLYRAALDKKIRSQMEVEDEYLEAWRRRDRSYEAVLEEARAREEEARQQVEEERREKEAAKVLAEEERRMKEEALAELEKLKRQLEERS
ncbi:hypothetical protein [Desulfonatronum parangueonense]